MKSERPWREFWILVSLAFLQLSLSGVFQTVIPSLYLSYLARGDSQVAEQLKGLERLGATVDPFQPTPEELESRKKLLGPLLERLPWASLGFLASLLVYPVLGRLAARFLARPESAGLLILLSVTIGQNPATIPMSLQYTGMGNIALPLPLVMLMVIFQFVALAAGIFSHPKVKRKRNQE